MIIMFVSAVAVAYTWPSETRQVEAAARGFRRSRKRKRGERRERQKERERDREREREREKERDGTSYVSWQ